MARIDSDFTTWLLENPAFSSSFTQWLWNEFWLQEYLADAPESGTPDYVSDAEDAETFDVATTYTIDPTDEETEDSGETDTDDTTTEEDDAPVTEDETPSDDPVSEDDSPTDVSDEEEDYSSDDESTDDDDTEEEMTESDDETTEPEDDPEDPLVPVEVADDMGMAHFALVSTGATAGFVDPFGHLLSLFAGRFAGFDFDFGESSDAPMPQGMEDGELSGTAMMDEFVFTETAPESPVASLDDLALADMLPEPEAGLLLPDLPDGWLF